MAGRATNIARALWDGHGNRFVSSNASSGYAYYPNGKIHTVTNADGTQTWAYDGRGLPTTLTVAEGTYTFHHDAAGRNDSLTFPDGHVRVQGYDLDGRITSRCYQYSDPSKTRCYGATYDPNGNPLTLTDPEGRDTIEYDALNRVRSVTRSATAQPDTVETYDYNALGALKLNAGVALDDQRPRLAGSGTADAGIPRTSGGQPVGLDPLGRVTSLGDTTLAWNIRATLDRVTTLAGNETYGHDEMMRRMARVPSVGAAEMYVYEGWSRIAVLRSGGNVVETYLFDGVDHPLRIHRPADAGATPPQPELRAYYELDIAGNVRRLRGTAGEDLGGYRYTAFGQTKTADTGTPAPSIEQPLRWKARWYSPYAGGMYDVRARQWSPVLGAFLSADGFQYLGATGTLWSWPGQNPVSWGDPSGHDYADLGGSAGLFIVGITGGAMMNDSGITLYLGGGLMTPGIGGTLTFSASDPTPNTWTQPVGVSAVVAFQGGYSDNGGTFTEWGLGLPVGASIAPYASFNTVPWSKLGLAKAPWQYFGISIPDKTAVALWTAQMNAQYDDAGLVCK